MTYILEITILNFLNPAERILHSSKVILSGVGKQTVGEILIMHTQHMTQVFFHFFHASITRGKILLIQNTETTSKSVSIFTNSKNRVVVLSMNLLQSISKKYLSKIVKLGILTPREDLSDSMKSSSSPTRKHNRIF